MKSLWALSLFFWNSSLPPAFNVFSLPLVLINLTTMCFNIHFTLETYWVSWICGSGIISFYSFSHNLLINDSNYTYLTIVEPQNSSTPPHWDVFSFVFTLDSFYWYALSPLHPLWSWSNQEPFISTLNTVFISKNLTGPVCLIWIFCALLYLPSLSLAQGFISHTF